MCSHHAKAEFETKQGATITCSMPDNACLPTTASVRIHHKQVDSEAETKRATALVPVRQLLPCEGQLDLALAASTSDQRQPKYMLVLSLLAINHRLLSPLGRLY